MEELRESIEEISKAAKIAATNIGAISGIYAVFEEDYHRLIEIDRKATQIEYLTGYSLNELLNKFAAGWTLVSPDYDKLSMGDLMKGD